MGYKLLIRDHADPDSVRQRRRDRRGGRETVKLGMAERAWENLSPVRRAYHRMLRFTYGDQWGSRIKVRGQWMKERDNLMRQGNVAMQVNLIKKAVNTVVGGVIRDGREPVANTVGEESRGYADLMTACLQGNWYDNYMSVVMANRVEDLMTGGLAAVRESYCRKDGVNDTWTEPVPVDNLFFDGPMKDPRMEDLTMVGQILECDFNTLCEKFAHSPEDVKRLAQWYPGTADPQEGPDSRDRDNMEDDPEMSFYSPTDSTKCRVIEIWTEERRPRYHVHDRNEGDLYDINADDRQAIARIRQLNEERLAQAREAGWPDEDAPVTEMTYFIDKYWYGMFLTPEGDVLWEGESPFPDRKPPFTILAIPYVNGVITGYMSDRADLNHAINRILTVDDWAKRAGVKGVSFIPQSLVPKDMTYEEFADQWTSIDGIIFYTPKPNVPDPKVFYGNPGQLNTSEMVKMMADLLDSSSPASGAIAGETPHAGTSAALYSQQTANSAIPLANFVDRFSMFYRKVAMKKMMLISQYYTPDRYVDIAGEYGVDIANLDLARMGDLRYKVKVRQGPSSEESEQMFEEDLRTWLQMQLLPWEDYLALSTRPNVAKLKARYDARMQQLQMQQAAIAQQEGESPEEQPQQSPEEYERSRRMFMEGA